MNQLQSIMILTVSLLAIATIVLTVLLVLHRRRISHLRVGLYGAGEPQLTVPIAPQSPEATLPSVAPVVQQPYQNYANPVPPTQFGTPTQPTMTPPENQLQQPQQLPPSPRPEDPFYK